ncbi:MAG: lysine--tRNA ligase [Alphaproteobacteria bacterium]|nr:lysine--tRNA ligase [Alphaproteobacteria bacterium]MDA7983729.1 lysine--tRNA ligase [Alphaproteobacteria bacterium]MDA8009968.1 lysine--tRNA ligase [Alphaproteobacteria bacterium]
MTQNIAALAADARAWPFNEARRIIKRHNNKCPARGYVLFQTGYGPSGLPHIGTFAEVARTTFVRNALEQMTGWPTRLFCISDDMDALRSVPDNIPDPESLVPHLGKPLTQIPDPFGTSGSFGEHNNARLRKFLDGFGFDYEFVSATRRYKDGHFDDALLNVLASYDKIMEVILPTLGEERRRTYSPILPVSPTTGRVLQTPILKIDAARGTVQFNDEDGSLAEIHVGGGNCKLQWKPDWGMRWNAFGVDYEMSGKDLIPSAELAAKICRILGTEPPVIFHYEFFLDEHGRKISKSRGNGLSVEEWLTYAPPQSLEWFMYAKPRVARRLYFDVIPKNTDEWIDAVQKWQQTPDEKRVETPLWHLLRYGGDGGSQNPAATAAVGVPFGLLLSLAAATGAPSEQILGSLVRRRGSGRELSETDVALIKYALAYHRDFIVPRQNPRVVGDGERAAFLDLAEVLAGLSADADASEIQNQVYEVGKRHDFPSLREWFRACYEVLFGQETGPRLGSFFHLYGLDDSVALIRTALDRK